MDAGPDAGSACSIQEEAAFLAGDAGLDCGGFLAALLLQPENWDAGFLAASTGVACALAAQDAGHPFRLQIAFSGADSTLDRTFVRTPAGASFLLSQSDESYPPGRCSHPAELDQVLCDSFSPSEFALHNLPDAGLPILSCNDAGEATILCGTPCN
jgi:hypothetical protein